MLSFKRKLDALMVFNNVKEEDMIMGISDFAEKHYNPELLTITDLRFIAKKFSVSLSFLCEDIFQKPCQKPCQNVVGK